MGEMTLKRACEVLNEHHHNDARWRLAGCSGAAGERGDHTQYLNVTELLAVAEYLERRSAPPAEERGDMTLDELGGAAYGAWVKHREDKANAKGYLRPQPGPWRDVDAEWRTEWLVIVQAVSAALQSASAAPPADAGAGDAELTGMESGILAGFQVLLQEVVQELNDGDVIEIQADQGRDRRISAATARIVLSAIDKLRMLAAAERPTAGPAGDERKRARAVLAIKAALARVGHEENVMLASPFCTGSYVAAGDLRELIRGG